MRALVMASIIVAVGACSTLQRDAAEGEVHVVYDPQNGKIPLPNDLARDEEAGHLKLPVDSEGLSKAEVELREFMNTHDAWPTTFGLSADVSAPVDPKTVSADTVMVYEWGTTPKRLTDVAMHLENGDTKIVIDAPLLGWTRGAQYVVAVRGKEGVRDKEGRGIVPDRTFYFLRAREKLDTYENNRAFPGATREERLEIGTKLEGLRLKLLPFFDGIERADDGPRREDVVALWHFSITKSAELAMDKASQRMPLPFDVLIDPKTKLISLPAAADDDTREKAAKEQLNRVNGFGVSPTVEMELTAAIEPQTATPANVRLYEIETGRELRIADVRVLPMEGAASCHGAVVPETCRKLVVNLPEQELPLRPATRYAIIVKSGLRARGGGSVRQMLMGHFVGAENPLVADGKSQIPALKLEDAERLEGVRTEIAPLLAKIGRGDVVAAWPFTTMDALPDLKEAAALPEKAGLDPNPKVTKTTDVKPGLLGLPSTSEIGVFDSMFPPLVDDVVGTLYVPRVRGVRRIIEGTIASPNTLDPATRARRADGGWAAEDIHFVLTLPEKPKDAGARVPVVMFGHGLVTDRRFVLMIAGALAQKGFAAIAFDFPFHGLRTRCTAHTLAAIPNFFPEDVRKLSDSLSGDLLRFPACGSGSTCNRDGRCATKDGNVTDYATIPMTDMPVAGGSALIDVADLPHISDRMRQALIDMRAVRRAVARANWPSITGGLDLERHRIFYTGQSLGGILGAVFTSASDDVERAVLNVPGADLVNLFQESVYFKPQMDEFLEAEKLLEGSYERARLMNVARWLMDTVDPHTLAGTLGKKRVLLQMSKGDIIIPNRVTERLQRASKLPLESYPSPFHGDLVMPVLGDAMLDDLVTFLANDTSK